MKEATHTYEKGRKNMMESAPTTEAVYQGVYTLYNNTNTVEQEKASKWLEQLQNSVSGCHTTDFRLDYFVLIIISIGLPHAK